MLCWHALYTRPRHEKHVFEELGARQIEAFLSTLKVRRRWSDRYKLIDEPLFKNYVFVCIDSDRYQDTLRPYGAVSLIKFDGRPAVIPEQEIGDVRRLVASELPYNLTRPIFCTNPSERVYITAWGCEIGSGRRNGLQAPGAGGL